ncbi:hypothetical protein FQA39_LY01243 [Lamprigera yunnana]|nr:hypothetical protein FQA39_LY01243 [Lamprigera yunnana]
MAPVLLFLAAHVALALNLNQYIENSTKVKQLYYFEREKYQAVIPSYLNKGSINGTRHKYEPLYNTSILRWNAPHLYKAHIRYISNSRSKIKKEKFPGYLNDTYNFIYNSALKGRKQLQNTQETKPTGKERDTKCNVKYNKDVTLNTSLVKDIVSNKNFTVNETKYNERRGNGTETTSTPLYLSKLLKNLYSNILQLYSKTNFTNSGKFNHVFTGKRHTYQPGTLIKALMKNSSVEVQLITRKKRKATSSVNKTATIEEEKIETANLANKAKFFETSTQKQFSTIPQVTTVAQDLKTNWTYTTLNQFSTVADTMNESYSSTVPSLVSDTKFEVETLANDSTVRSIDDFQPTGFSNYSNPAKTILLPYCSSCFNESKVIISDQLLEINNLTIQTMNDTLITNEDDRQESTQSIRGFTQFSTLNSYIITEGGDNNLTEVLVTRSPDSKEFTLTGDTIVETPVNVSVKLTSEFPWPVKREAVVEGDLVLGGLMMVHEREDTVTCGPIMPQGGIQALEAMLYTLDRLNEVSPSLLPNITIGAHILDDCDKDTYGLEMAVDFIKANSLEECLLKLKDYDNHRQQANFMIFMRQKGQNKQNYKPINNYQKPQQFKPHQNNLPNFNPQNASTQFNYNPQIPTNNQYPTNKEVFGKKIESRPTLMSISTRNANANYRSNFPRQQNVFQLNGPRNFKSEELFNIKEGHNDFVPIQDDFE